MKKILIFLSIILVITIPNTTNACMGFGCKADMMILAEVISKENTTAHVKPFHIFPKSNLPTLDGILINDEENELGIGKKYALSLIKNDDRYRANWDVLEVEGTSYQNVKLVSIKTGEDAWLQWWMNSNGKEPETNSYIVNDALFFRIGNPESPFFQDIQVYPKPFFSDQMIYFTIASFIIGAGGTYVLLNKKKKQSI